MQRCIEFRFMNYFMDMLYGTRKQKKEAVYKFRRLKININAGDDFARFILINLGDALKDGMLWKLMEFVDNIQEYR